MVALLKAAGALLVLLGIVTLIESVVIGLLMAALGVFAVWYSDKKESEQSGVSSEYASRSGSCSMCGAPWRANLGGEAPKVCQKCGSPINVRRP